LRDEATLIVFRKYFFTEFSQDFLTMRNRCFTAKNGSEVRLVA